MELTRNQRVAGVAVVVGLVIALIAVAVVAAVGWTRPVTKSSKGGLIQAQQPKLTTVTAKNYAANQLKLPSAAIAAAAGTAHIEPTTSMLADSEVLEGKMGSVMSVLVRPRSRIKQSGRSILWSIGLWLSGFEEARPGEEAVDPARTHQEDVRAALDAAQAPPAVGVPATKAVLRPVPPRYALSSDSAEVLQGSWSTAADFLAEIPMGGVDDPVQMVLPTALVEHFPGHLIKLVEPPQSLSTLQLWKQKVQGAQAVRAAINEAAVSRPRHAEQQDIAPHVRIQLLPPTAPSDQGPSLVIQLTGPSDLIRSYQEYQLKPNSAWIPIYNGLEKVQAFPSGSVWHAALGGEIGSSVDLPSPLLGNIRLGDAIRGSRSGTWWFTSPLEDMDLPDPLPTGSWYIQSEPTTGVHNLRIVVPWLGLNPVMRTALKASDLPCFTFKREQVVVRALMSVDLHTDGASQSVMKNHNIEVVRAAPSDLVTAVFVGQSSVIDDVVSFMRDQDTLEWIFGGQDLVRRRQVPVTDSLLVEAVHCPLPNSKLLYIQCLTDTAAIMSGLLGNGLDQLRLSPTNTSAAAPPEEVPRGWVMQQTEAIAAAYVPDGDRNYWELTVLVGQQSDLVSGDPVTEVQDGGGLVVNDPMRRSLDLTCMRFGNTPAHQVIATVLLSNIHRPWEGDNFPFKGKTLVAGGSRFWTVQGQKLPNIAPGEDIKRNYDLPMLFHLVAKCQLVHVKRTMEPVQWQWHGPQGRPTSEFMILGSFLEAGSVYMDGMIREVALGVITHLGAVVLNRTGDNYPVVTTYNGKAYCFACESNCSPQKSSSHEQAPYGGPDTSVNFRGYACGGCTPPP